MSQSIPLSALETSPAAKFESMGDKYVGKIMSMEERAQTDLQGRVVTFADGSPRMQWVITLQQANGDVVALYAKGGSFAAKIGTGESMTSAIATAVRAANAQSVDVGGQLAVAHTGLGEAKPGQNPPKLYTAQYQPPVARSVPVDDLFAS